MNVEVGNEAAQLPEKEFMNGIFVAVRRPTRQERRPGRDHPSYSGTLTAELEKLPPEFCCVLNHFFKAYI
jgi:hypothetical protein